MDDRSDTDEAAVDEFEDRHVVAVIPMRLAVHELIDIQDFVREAEIIDAGDAAAEWQTTSQRATWWEMGGTMHGVQRDRMTEIARLMAGAGEQLALARS